MANIVLIHGGWHGGWCWKKVAPLLRAAGHEVYTPTLTGLGDRSHLLSVDVTLDTHVQDIVALFEYEDIREAVLVGHSYGGIVMTAVADRVAERLAHLIYLDAFVPQHGQSLADLADPAFFATMEARAHMEGDGWRVPAPPLERWGIRDEADALWMRPRIGPHPLNTFKQPVQLSNSAASLLPRTFVYCTDKPAGDSFAPFAKRLRQDAGWRYCELASGHDAMVTAPKEVSELICESVQ